MEIRDLAFMIACSDPRIERYRIIATLVVQIIAAVSVVILFGIN